MGCCWSCFLLLFLSAICPFHSRCHAPATAFPRSNMAGTSVDRLWAALKQQNDVRCTTDSFEKMWQGFSSDRRPLAPADRKQQQQPDRHGPSHQHKSSQPAIATQQLSFEGAALDRLVQALQAPEASTRRAALQQLQANLEAALAQQHTNAMVGCAAKLCKALLRRFDDKSEACRELAVSSVKQLLQAAPDATLALLPYLMPVLVERLGRADQAVSPSEPAEDIRWLLVQLLELLLQQAGSAVAAYASEVWCVLSATLGDAFHEVAITACQAAQQLTALLGLRLGSMAEELVAALLPLTGHKRHRVRVAAVDAIRDAVHQGGHKMILEMVAWRDPNLVPIKAFYGDDLKINYCGRLASDTHPQVRLAFVRMVGSWLGSLRERRDHEARLLPYLLSGLCDDSPAVVAAAMQLLDALGQQYEQEHEADLADLLRFAEAAGGEGEARFARCLREGSVQYGEASSNSSSSSSCAEEIAAAASSSGSGSSLESDRQRRQQAAGPVLRLPGPFSRRPRLGARLLAGNNFGPVVGAMCGELSSWQSGPRVQVAQLLLVNLVVAEAAAARHAQVLLPALCAAVTEPEVAEAVRECATLLGCHCQFGLLLDLLRGRLHDLAGSPGQQADVLLVLASVIRGAGPLHRLEGHWAALSALLAEPELADSRDSRLMAAVATVSQQIASHLSASE